MSGCQCGTDSDLTNVPETEFSLWGNRENEPWPSFTPLAGRPRTVTVRRINKSCDSCVISSRSATFSVWLMAVSCTGLNPFHNNVWLSIISDPYYRKWDEPAVQFSDTDFLALLGYSPGANLKLQMIWLQVQSTCFRVLSSQKVLPILKLVQIIYSAWSCSI